MHLKKKKGSAETKAFNWQAGWHGGKADIFQNLKKQNKKKNMKSKKNAKHSVECVNITL